MRDEVEHVSHRLFHGFFFGQPGQYTESSRYLRDWQICAVVESCDEDGNAVLSLRNKFARATRWSWSDPTASRFRGLRAACRIWTGLPLTEPRTPQMRFRARLPKQVPAMSFVRHAVELSGK